MTAFVNYPLTASDDDEFFDAPAGAVLINPAGALAWTRGSEGWAWTGLPGVEQNAGAIWASFFQDGNPFGEYDITPGWTLRVPLEWAKAYGLAANREAAEAEAEARVAAWMAGAR